MAVANAIIVPSLPLGQRSLHNRPRMSVHSLFPQVGPYTPLIPFDGVVGVVLHLVYPLKSDRFLVG